MHTTKVVGTGLGLLAFCVLVGQIADGSVGREEEPRVSCRCGSQARR